MSELLIKHDLDLKNRRIMITGEITSETYTKVLKALTILTTMVDPTDLVTDGIEFVVNTEGGDFYQALAIYDLIQNCKYPTRSLCIGPVMSAGTIIVQATNRRYATQNAVLMIHYGSDQNESLAELKNNLEMLKLMKDIYQKKSLASNYVINKWFKADTYFTAKKALSIGLIDEILNEKTR